MGRKGAKRIKAEVRPLRFQPRYTVHTANPASLYFEVQGSYKPNTGGTEDPSITNHIRGLRTVS